MKVHHCVSLRNNLCNFWPLDTGYETENIHLKFTPKLAKVKTQESLLCTASYYLTVNDLQQRFKDTQDTKSPAKKHISHYDLLSVTRTDDSLHRHGVVNTFLSTPL